MSENTKPETKFFHSENLKMISVCDRSNGNSVFNRPYKCYHQVNGKMTLSAAERQRRCREKRKLNPENVAEVKRKDLERYHARKKLVKHMTPKEHKTIKGQWQIRNKMRRERQKALQNVLMNTPASTPHPSSLRLLPLSPRSRSLTQASSTASARGRKQVRRHNTRYTECSTMQKEAPIKIETNPVFNDSEKMHAICYEREKIKDEELIIKKEDLEQNPNRYTGCFPMQKETLIKAETSRVINDTGKTNEVWIKEEDLEQVTRHAETDTETKPQVRIANEEDISGFKYEMSSEPWTIKNEELNLKEKSLEPNETGYKECFSMQKEAPIKIEANPIINKCGETQELGYEDWKLKNEELDIKEEDLEQKTTSILPDCHWQDTSRQTFVPNHSTANKNTLCIKIPTSLKSTKGQVLKYGNCNLDALRKDGLKDHLFYHRNLQEDLLKCSDCKLNTCSKRSWKGRLFHPNSEERTMFQCYVCGQQTSCKRSLKRHILRHKNPEERKKFECDVCGQQTSRKSSLTRHMLQHKNPEEREKFKCDVCGYQTFRNSCLKIHMLQHKDPEERKKFKCDVCGQQTSYKSSLKGHMLRHKNPEEREKFECDICGHQTFRKGYLKIHMLQHKDPKERKKFECDICGHQTSRKGYLKIHMLQHKDPEERKKYKCDVCGLQTFCTKSLKKHMLRHKNPEERKKFE